MRRCMCEWQTHRGVFCRRFGVGCSRRHTHTTGRSWCRCLQATDTSVSVSASVDADATLPAVGDDGDTRRIACISSIHLQCAATHAHPCPRYRAVSNLAQFLDCVDQLAAVEHVQTGHFAQIFKVFVCEFGQILQRDVEAMDNKNQMHRSVLVSPEPTCPHTTACNECLVLVPRRALTCSQVTPSSAANDTILRSMPAAAHHCVVWPWNTWR